MQSAIDTKFKDSGNFPNLTNIKKDRDGNILDKNGNVVLQPYSDFFGDNDAIFLASFSFALSSVRKQPITKRSTINSIGIGI